MLPPFPRKKEGDRLGAGHLNSLSAAAEQYLASAVGGFQLGTNKGTSGLPPWSQASFEITALGCDDETDPDVYTIKPYYFDPDTETWTLDDDHLGFCLDDRLVQTGYEVGDVVQAYFNSQRGAFVPLSSPPLTLRHGIVISREGCGYYVVELAEWSGNEDTSGVGVGTGTGTGSDDCNVCYAVTGEGTDTCGIELTYPPAQVTGLGIYVRAYHRASVLVPLRVGSACLLANLNDEDQAGTGTGTGTGTNAGTAVWQIVDGLQEHTVQYIEEWDCCAASDGVERLITRTPVIFAALVCDPISCDSCPTTGTGS